MSDEKKIDYLAKAKSILDGVGYLVDDTPEQAQAYSLAAIAHAQIALIERLDKMLTTDGDCLVL